MQFPFAAQQKMSQIRNASLCVHLQYAWDRGFYLYIALPKSEKIFEINVL